MTAGLEAGVNDRRRHCPATCFTDSDPLCLLATSAHEANLALPTRCYDAVGNEFGPTAMGQGYENKINLTHAYVHMLNSITEALCTCETTAKFTRLQGGISLKTVIFNRCLL